MYGHRIGVDIASTMIERAKELHADLNNVRFVENVQPDLRGILSMGKRWLWVGTGINHPAKGITNR